MSCIALMHCVQYSSSSTEKFRWYFRFCGGVATPQDNSKTKRDDLEIKIALRERWCMNLMTKFCWNMAVYRRTPRFQGPLKRSDVVNGSFWLVMNITNFHWMLIVSIFGDCRCSTSQVVYWVIRSERIKIRSLSANVWDISVTLFGLTKIYAHILFQL